MKKLSLIYDISILANHYAQTGVYFVALNILRELKKRDDVALSLYCESSDINKSKSIIANVLKSDDLPCIFVANGLGLSKFKPIVKKIISKLPNTIQSPLHEFINLVLNTLIRIKKRLKAKKGLSEQESSKLKEYDAFLSPCFSVANEFKSINNYIFLHDTIPLILDGYKNNPSNYWILEMIEQIGGNQRYFSNSQNTKNDFLKFATQLKDSDITVALLACDESFKQASKEQIKAIKQKYNIPEHKKYIFSLCNLEPRKNLIRTVRTFIDFIKKHSIDDLVFVLGGAHWEKFIKELEKSINDLGSFKDKILKIGYVDDEDLAAPYSGAEFFVYTSQYEGFGLPPLEAMSCGAAVITSDNSSLPEVVGDAGIMIPYDSDEAHIKAYEDYYFNPQLKEANAKKGLEQAKKFSWEKCVNIMVEKMKEDIEKVSNNL